MTQDDTSSRCWAPGSMRRTPGMGRACQRPSHLHAVWTIQRGARILFSGAAAVFLRRNSDDVSNFLFVSGGSIPSENHSHNIGLHLDTGADLELRLVGAAVNCFERYVVHSLLFCLTKARDALSPPATGKHQREARHEGVEIFGA
jgi:hypothetical protein